MPLIIPSNSITGGYEVANSLRFDRVSNDQLTRTFSSAGNRKTWSFSTWIKRSNLINANMNILGTDYTVPSGEAYLLFRPGEKLLYGQYDSGGSGNNYSFETNQLFRDISAWYNILFVWDTTQSTSSDRMKLYVNGSQITSFSSSTYPTLNLDGVWNNARTHYIGDAQFGTNLDGYLAETVFVDGTALTPTDVGEFDTDTNIWKPIDVSGLTFGTNGFYLDYEDSGSLGADVSGNGNNFTVNNLTSIDQTTDTPTNNYATGNPLIPSTLTYSDGNCTIQRTTSDWESTGSTIALTQGKWYAEFKWISGTYTIIGVEDMDLVSTWDNLYIGYTANGRGYGWDGNARNNASTSAFGNTFTTGDIIGVALDMDNNFVYMSKNGTFQNSGDPTSGATGTGGLSLAGTEYIIGWSAYNSVVSANFGNPPFTISSGNSDANGYGNFEYAVPSGYYALNSKNLAEFG